MRRVIITVGKAPVGEARTWAYPEGSSLGYYLVPIYKLTVSGTDDRGGLVQETFEVLRFGVQCKDGRTAQVVGLADQQTHQIKAWIPTYRVHSAASPENGAWQVYGNFLIHDGPDDPTEVFATIGCIEIMGRQGFVKFNDLILSLSGAAAGSRDGQLRQIGQAGQMVITYEKAVRPPLKKAP